MKILLYDIETAPNLAWVWGKYQQDAIAFESEWYMLSWSAKWLKGKQVTRGLVDYPGYSPEAQDDRLLCEELHDLISEADIVVAHNGDRFDNKRINTRFLEHGMPPPTPYRSVDTLKIARKYFAFTSNRLDDLGRRLKVGRKVKHSGFALWLGCLQGDPAAWKKMKRYNHQDVRLLERVYLKLRGWAEHHPNVSFNDEKCPKCGSKKIQRRGFGSTRTGQFQRYWCRSCKGWSRGRHMKLTDVR